MSAALCTHTHFGRSGHILIVMVDSDSEGHGGHSHRRSHRGDDDAAGILLDS